jgi:hypothetical protein
MALGTVTEVKGDVFVKDIAGTITKLKVGDVDRIGSNHLWSRRERKL